MHAATILTVAVAAFTGSFALIALVARWLATTGRLGDPDRSVPFALYGPVIAGALSLGMLVIHLSIVADHASHTAAASDAVLFLCAVGAVTAHPAVADATVLGFLPVGVASLIVTPLQGVWAWPRAWRSRMAAIAGGLVSVVALAITTVQLAMQPLLVGPTAAQTGIGAAAVVALLVEGLMLVPVAILLAGRPHGVLSSLRIPAIDAVVACALAVVAVAVITVVALTTGHAAH